MKASTAKVSSRLRLIPTEVAHQTSIPSKRRIASDVMHSKTSKPALRSPTEPKKADKMRVCALWNIINYILNIINVLYNVLYMFL